MATLDRRRFLQLTGGAGGVAALSALSALPSSIARAAAVPANRKHGSLEDVEHVVVLIQENRSFDHYFGTLRGVRGYGDPHPAVLPSGKPVWHQSDGTKDVLPFRPDMDDLGLAFIQDLDHGWDGGHAAFNGGRYDQWVPTKTSTTMAHLARRDVPFHYALADAFTICDAYHCSLLGPTDPNRYYAWTGWVGNDGKGGGPVIANDELGYSWTTYPERLQKAGVSWKIYQDVGTGLDAAGSWGWGSDPYIGNYGDNSLLYFDQYRNAQPGNPLYDRARTGTDVSKGGTFFDQLRADVKAGTLPQVSWVVAPEAFTEHPNWPANYGAWYISQVLDALTADPEVWSKTALLITYDENDGFFDHVVPPYANTTTLRGASTVSTAHELYVGAEGTPGPYGLGQRVPMLVVSPWSTGGWVCSETFDHTSMIRFIEKRFGVTEPNITPWRRAVCGDLTSAFDFGRTRTSAPSLPGTAGYKPRDSERHPDYKPVPPTKGAVPTQESGVRPSRSLGYALDVRASVESGRLTLGMGNRGRLGAQLQVRSTTLPGAPWSYTVGAGDAVSPAWPVLGPYALDVHGPDGFFRRFTGTGAAPVETTLATRGADVELTLHNPTRSTVVAQVTDAYGRRPHRVVVHAGRSEALRVPTSHTGSWYDLTVTVPKHAGFGRTLAGRVHTGTPGTSDPQLGRH